ncbi:MAG: deoxyribose-phosphate aldolase [Thermosynechococcaceae cyanobacterium]
MSLSTVDLDLADYIDHTLLDPFASPEAIAQLCEQAQQFHFPAVCVYPIHVKQAAECLHRSEQRVCTVIGFPSGATTAAVKRYEAEEALEQGAMELDVVVNLGWVRQGLWDAVHQELAEICALSSVTVKAILETTLLNDAEKRQAATVCMEAGVAFVKTSTGWHGGATVEDVKLLKEVTRDRIGIKASGGIRSVEQALALILAGATRLGTSQGVVLIRTRDQSDRSMETA